MNGNPFNRFASFLVNFQCCFNGGSGSAHGVREDNNIPSHVSAYLYSTEFCADNPPFCVCFSIDGDVILPDSTWVQEIVKRIKTDLGGGSPCSCQIYTRHFGSGINKR